MTGVENSPLRFNRILLTTDFSSVSDKALPYAAAISRHFGATLYLAHVIPTEDYAQIPPAEHDVALAQMKQGAERQITALLASSHFQDIPHRILLDHGEVLNVLSRMVQTNAIDLMVTGTHGRYGLRKLLSGSLAEEIFRVASPPVLAVGPEVGIRPQAEVHIERILYAADFSPGSGPALRYAYALAKEYGAHLYFLHVIEDVWKEPASTRMPADAFCRLQLLERGLPERMDGIEPEFMVEFGSPEDLILEIANKYEVQLLVLNVPRTAHPALSAHLPGPLAYNIVNHARCPVLGVRSTAETAQGEGPNTQSATG